MKDVNKTTSAHKRTFQLRSSVIIWTQTCWSLWHNKSKPNDADDDDDDGDDDANDDDDDDDNDIQTKQWAIAKEGDPIKKIATVAVSLESFEQRNIWWWLCWQRID